MPDKMGISWYAAWDPAFHCVPLAMVDPGFAKISLSSSPRMVYASQRSAACVRMGLQ